jgi:hypothetical protein
MFFFFDHGWSLIGHVYEESGDFNLHSIDLDKFFHKEED